MRCLHRILVKDHACDTLYRALPVIAWSETGSALFIISVLWAFCASAYENSLPNLNTPSALVPITLEIDIQHRFGRDLTKQRVSNFFDGANTTMEARTAVWRGLEAYGEYATGGNAFSGGMGYSHTFERIMIRLRADVSYFSYELTPRHNRAGNFFYMISVQSTPFFDHLSIGSNAAYDAYNRHPGLGLTVVVRLADIIDVFGELAPLVGSSDSPLHSKFTSYSGGVKINTGGHHFKLMVSNNTGIGSRLFMLGAPSNAPHFGFSIERLFRFNQL